jgi:hypothetical protein
MTWLALFETVKDLVQETIERGVASVEQIHRATAGLPFEILATLGVPDPLRLRERQERVIGAVYGAVRETNRHVGTLLSDAFEALEDGLHVGRVLGGAASASGGAGGAPGGLAPGQGLRGG